MSELANNNNKGDVLYLTLNKFDDQKNQDQDISMDLKDKRKNSRKKDKKHKKGKKDKKDKKHNKECNKHSKKKDTNNNKSDKYVKKTEKLTNKIISLVNITKEKQAYHINQAASFGKKANDLENLLNFAPGMDFIDIKKELLKIIKSSKKEWKNQRKILTKEKKSEKKRKFLLKKQEKMEKRKIKMKKKKEKMEKQATIEKGRIEELPFLNIDKNDYLEIFIDGYNIIGCDKLCRKNMRGKKYLARERLLELVYAFFNERNLNIGCQIVVNVWFDGNGKDIKYNNAINVKFSGKESVDDTLVKMFEKPSKLDNKVIITSDKEFTFRLVNLGVKCMKSGMFYKKYLQNEKIVIKNGNVINMVIDGQDNADDGDIETRLANDLQANDDHDKSSTSDNDDDDEDEDDEDEDDCGLDEFDVIEMELEGIDSQPGSISYPSPK